MNSDIPIPPEIQRGMKETQRLIEDYEEQKKYQQRYIIVKRSIEAAREARPAPTENIKDQKAITYYGENKDIIEKKIQTLQQRYQEQLEILEKNYRSQLSKLTSSLEFTETRLKSIQSRSTTYTKKTKEEIKAEKEALQLINDYRARFPERNLEFDFPNFKDLLPPELLDIPLPPSPPIQEKKPIEKKMEEKPKEELEPILEQHPIEEPKVFEISKYGKRVGEIGLICPINRNRCRQMHIIRFLMIPTIFMNRDTRESAINRIKEI